MWKCDVCGQDIATIQDGWVECIGYDDPLTGDRKERDWRLVHASAASPLGRSGCQFNQRAEHAKDGGIVLDLPLSSYVGDNGLTNLLSTLSEGKAPKAEVLELIKRLHTPYYEEARPHIPQAVHQGIIEPNLPEGYYWQNSLKTVLEHISGGVPSPAVKPRP